MQRTFNYTNRQNVVQDLVEINVTSIDGATSFTASIKSADLDFPGDAKVFFEAYYGPTTYRFDFGTFSAIQQPSNTDISALKRLTDKMYFRLKIVDAENGLVLGVADKIDLADDPQKGRETIFYVNAVEMDTREIWRLNFEANDEGIPVLEINSSIEGIREIAKTDPRFFSLVYPAAIRIILERIVENKSLTRDGANWESKWIIFIEDVLNVNTTPENDVSEDDVHHWYDDVVRAFCFRNKLYEQFVNAQSQ